MKTTLIEIRKECQGKYKTHIQINSTSNATSIMIVELQEGKYPVPGRDVEIQIIRHEAKVQRLSKKMLESYHQQGIEQAKEKYKDLI